MRIDIFHPWAGLKVHGGDSPSLWSKHDLHKQVEKLNILILMCQSLVFNWLILIKTPLAQTGEKTEHFTFNVSKSCILSCYIHQNLHKQVHTENLY